MSRKPIAVAAGLLLLAAGIALSHQDGGFQPPPGPPMPIPSAPGVNTPLALPIGGSGALPPGAVHGIPPLSPPAAVTPVATKPPPEPTLDELLASLEKLRGEKSELEKKEQELVKVIQKKAAEQKARMEKLGVNLAPAMPPIPVVPVGGIAPPVPNSLTKY